jgi:cytochrome oxidase assembly protein ShyY1
MNRWPLIPTLLVAAAVAVMIGLGIWQLGRAREKDLLAALYERNARQPAMALPSIGGFDERLTFRKASAFCLEVVGWRQAGGKTRAGKSGTRQIAECRSGAEGPGFVADMGVSADPSARPVWKGGDVTGTLVPERGSGGLIERLTGSASPPRPMLISDTPAPGLEASAAPGPDSLVNNSLMYAVQWFFFAAVAAAIYGLALRRRQKLPPGGSGTTSGG